MHGHHSHEHQIVELFAPVRVNLKLAKYTADTTPRREDAQYTRTVGINEFPVGPSKTRRTLPINGMVGCRGPSKDYMAATQQFKPSNLSLGEKGFKFHVLPPYLVLRIDCFSEAYAKSLEEARAANTGHSWRGLVAGTRVKDHVRLPQI